MKFNSEYLTAIHEIGHCVAYNEFGLKFKYVSIVKENDTLGHVASLGIFKIASFDYFNIKKSCSQKRLEAEIVISICGNTAECKYLNKKNTKKDEDYSKYSELIFRMYDNPIIMRKYYLFLNSIAENIIERRWDLITHLADILLIKKTLSYDEYKQEKKEFIINKISNIQKVLL
jgi:hypothetical protein